VSEESSDRCTGGATAGLDDEADGHEGVCILDGETAGLDCVRVLVGGETGLKLGEPPCLDAVGTDWGLGGGGDTPGRDDDCEPPHRRGGDTACLDGEKHGRDRGGETAARAVLPARWLPWKIGRREGAAAAGWEG